MSDEVVEINGVRYRRVSPSQSYVQPEQEQLKTRGQILMEAAAYAPIGHSIISGAPSSSQSQPMNPYNTMCLSCNHMLVETNCPQHGSGGDYLFFQGSNPPGYFHRKCLGQTLEDRKKQMLTDMDTSGLKHK